MEIRSNFESILPSESVQDHLTRCSYNPNSILCDKGCSMRVTRQEYESSSCIAHLTNAVNRQEAQIAQLTKVKSDEDCQQSEKIMQLNDEVIRLRCQLIKSEETIVAQQKENANLFCIYRPPRRRWQALVNINIPIDQPNILESDGSYHAFAQSFFYSYFRIKILDGAQNNVITIGLTLKDHPHTLAPGNHEGSIGYNNNGNFWLDKSTKKVGENWKNGDLIQCCLTIANSFAGDERRSVVVDFSRNGKSIIKNLVEVPSEGLLAFLPTVYMYRNFYSSVYPKIEYLNN